MTEKEDYLQPTEDQRARRSQFLATMLVGLRFFDDPFSLDEVKFARLLLDSIKRQKPVVPAKWIQICDAFADAVDDFYFGDEWMERTKRRTEGAQ